MNFQLLKNKQAYKNKNRTALECSAGLLQYKCATQPGSHEKQTPGSKK